MPSEVPSVAHFITWNYLSSTCKLIEIKTWFNFKTLNIRNEKKSYQEDKVEEEKTVGASGEST